MTFFGQVTYYVDQYDKNYIFFTTFTWLSHILILWNMVSNQKLVLAAGAIFRGNTIINVALLDR